MQKSKEYFDRLANKRARFIKRNRYYYRDLIKFLKYSVPQDASVIELGCGIGNVISALPNTNKVGVDFSDKMIEEAKKKNPNVKYNIDDIENLNHSQSYDYVLLLDAINSLNDVQKTLTDLRMKLCHDRTRIVITYYNILWEPIMRLGEILHIKTPSLKQSWLSRGDVRALLDLARFEVVTEGERLLFPKFFPALSWLLNVFIAKLPILRRLCLVQYVIARPLPYERKEYSVSILIPARNESGNIERALKEIPKFGTSQEIIFVEGNSTDDTWEVIKEMSEKYKNEWEIQCLQQPGKGKGDAVRAGFAKAKKEVLMILDADLTVDPSELPKFYEAIAGGTGEFINGSRLVYPMDKEAMRILNMIANKCFGVLFTWILGQRLKDTLCGTKVLLKSDYDRITANRSYFGDFDPFGDFDLLFGSAKQNLKIIDVPIRYRDRTYGSTNISRFRHGLLLLRMTVFAARKMKFY
jgi:SAM-dependent methyltransferase